MTSIQKPKVAVNDLRTAQAVRQVAHALSLYLSGKFGPPRVLSFGPLLQTVILRADNDNDGVADAYQAADLIAQAGEFRALGAVQSAGLNQSSVDAIGGRTGVMLSRAADTLENLWPVITRLSNALIKDGFICGRDFTQAMEGDVRPYARKASPRAESN